MQNTSKKTLSGAICELLGISDALQKATAARHLIADWKETTLALGNQPSPDQLGRPGHPSLRPPREVPRLRITQTASDRMALLHAITHVELNAVDLALEMANRWSKTQLR